MHPTLARYLNPDVALDTLTRDERGQVLKSEEQPFAQAARAHADKRQVLLEARGKSPLPPEAQQALLALATYAAVETLRADESFGPVVEAARAALEGEGASPEEVEQFLGSVVLEEAFAWEEDPDSFDRAFLEETLRGVPALARLTPDGVDALTDGFVDPAPNEWKRAYARASRELLEAAWSEGPEPINVEHVAEALENIGGQPGDAQRDRGVEALRRFLEHLAQAGLLGPVRKARLFAVLDEAAREDGGEPGPVN